MGILHRARSRNDGIHSEVARMLPLYCHNEATLQHHLTRRMQIVGVRFARQQSVNHAHQTMTSRWEIPQLSHREMSLQSAVAGTDTICRLETMHTQIEYHLFHLETTDQK